MMGPAGYIAPVRGVERVGSIRYGANRRHVQSRLMLSRQRMSLLSRFIEILRCQPGADGGPICWQEIPSNRNPNVQVAQTVVGGVARRQA